MIRLPVYILAFLIAGVKFFVLEEKLDLSKVPPDTWPRLREPGKWIHDMTNLAVEAVRSDPQWFTKFFMWVIIIETANLIAALLW